MAHPSNEWWLDLADALDAVGILPTTGGAVGTAGAGSLAHGSDEWRVDTPDSIDFVGRVAFLTAGVSAAATGLIHMVDEWFVDTPDSLDRPGRKRHGSGTALFFFVDVAQSGGRGTRIQGGGGKGIVLQSGGGRA